MLLKNTLAAMETKYHVKIVIKDLYSLMQINPALIDLLRRFYAHENPYCVHIKENGNARMECTRAEHTDIGRQMNSTPELFENGALVTCPFGVREYYYPIRCSGHTVGALLVGCSPCAAEEFEALQKKAAEKYGFSEKKMAELYKTHLLPCQIPDTEEFQREVALCGEMLSMICEKLMAGLNLDGFFRYNFIMNDSNLYVDVDSTLKGNRLVSKSAMGENRIMTIILNTITYIHNNYQNRITIEDIAKYCYCSSSTLSHVFAKNYGMTISKLILTVRCDRAKILLRKSMMSVNQIAAECGFSSADYFTSVFKNLTGMTPSEYRITENTDDGTESR